MLLHAFAKINLDLRVLGKRADGYHELRTVFQSIDWCDDIRIESADSFEFSASEGPQDESNLVVRAVRAFEFSFGRRVDVRIQLTKKIPSGAGLGGGSSDAAVTFLGLQSFYGWAPSPNDQFQALRVLGSDVPFFASGGCAIGTGRGDELELLPDNADLTNYWLTLVNPGVPIATREAYSWLTVPDKSNSIEGFCAQFVPGSGHAEPINDFEMPVFERYPQLREIRDELLRIGAFRATLSGSGSVVFGEFRTEREARDAVSRLGRRFAATVTRPLSRAEYFLRMVD